MPSTGRHIFISDKKDIIRVIAGLWLTHKTTALNVPLINSTYSDTPKWSTTFKYRHIFGLGIWLPIANIPAWNLEKRGT
jgi:hypothetical protein